MPHEYSEEANREMRVVLLRTLCGPERALTLTALHQQTAPVIERRFKRRPCRETIADMLQTLDGVVQHTGHLYSIR